MSVVCDLDYLEKTLELPKGDEGVARSVRDYQKVSAVVKASSIHDNRPSSPTTI